LNSDNFILDFLISPKESFLTPQLQLALDGDLSSSLAVLAAVRPYIDIAEIGTPLIYREGVAAVKMLRAAYPDLTLLADLKIMDAGDEEAAIAFEAGADIVTVLGVTTDETISGAVAAARRYGGRVLADMMQVADMARRAARLLGLGCDWLCVHTAYDLQQGGATPLEHLRNLRARLPDAPLAVAGGVKLTTLEGVLAFAPQIVVVGGAITRAAEPAAVARAMRERMQS
jgi:3-hexulose-6-phosphate synthase